MLKSLTIRNSETQTSAENMVFNRSRHKVSMLKGNSNLLRTIVFGFFSIFVFFMLGCEKQKETKHVNEPRHFDGDIEVQNSCGIDGAAAEMREFLRLNGFDVVSSTNDRLQTNTETILVVHTADWKGTETLAQLLKTENVLFVKNKHSYVDATIHIGKDFKKIIQQDSL